MRLIISIATLIAFCVPAFAGGESTRAEAPATRQSEPMIKAGDLITTSISDLFQPGQDTIRTQRVDAEGNISLPYLRKTIAKELTCRQLEAAIAKAYRDAKLVDNAKVTVEIVVPTPKGADAGIQAGDLLAITISDLVQPGQDAIRTCRVDREGKINLPYLEKVSAQGLTCQQLASAISRGYREMTIDDVRVTVTFAKE